MASARVLAFGVFDPLHEGHRQFLQQAKTLGDYLIVVVTRDDVIQVSRGREPYQSEEVRLRKVDELSAVDEVCLGEMAAGSYGLLDQLEFDVLALGYDQEPSDDIVRRELDTRGKQKVRIVRLEPYHPEKYKSTYLRTPDAN